MAPGPGSPDNAEPITIAKLALFPAALAAAYRRGASGWLEAPPMDARRVDGDGHADTLLFTGLRLWQLGQRRGRLIVRPIQR